MAVSIVDPDLGSSVHNSSVSYRFPRRGLVDSGTAHYFFYIDGAQQLKYRKSSNNGFTWSSLVTIHAATYQAVEVWFDKWTPGDSGTVVHIWALKDDGDINYFSLDVSSDTLGNGGTGILAFDGASVSIVTGGVELVGCKARGGNLYLAFDIDGGTETGFVRSTDNGANWTLRANPNEATSDYYLLFPGNESDNQDMWLVYWDRSANELSLKTYDDSADSWAETSISGSMTDIAKSTVNTQFAGCMNLDNNHLYLAAWNNRNDAAADLQTWDINGAGSITAKTNVITNVQNSNNCILTYMQDRVICLYAGKSDNTEVLGTNIGVYYKQSFDGMTTWSSDYPAGIEFATSEEIRNISGGLYSISRRAPFCMYYIPDYVSANEVCFCSPHVGVARAGSLL